MPDLPLVGHRDELLEDIGATASSVGTSVTSSGTVNTKGSYAQLVAATTRMARAVSLHCRQSSGVAEGLFDLAIGGAGAEQVVISNLQLSLGTTSESFYIARIPILIPAGVRLAGRYANTVASKTVSVRAHLHVPGSNALPALSAAEGIGVDAGTSGGTAVDGGATANTKGAWAQLVASAAKTYRAFYVLLSNNALATRTSADFLVDIGIGGAGSEQVIVPNLQITTNTSEQVADRIMGPFWITIPSGTRIAARCQSSSTNASDRVIDVSLLGVY